MRSPFIVFLCACLLSCSSESSPPAQPEPEPVPPDDSGLGDEPIPEDFTFQATRPVEVGIATEVASEGESGPPQRFRLEVRTQTGDIIFRGSLVPGEEFRFNFPLAPDTTSLEFVTIDDSGIATSKVVTVDPAKPGISVVLGGAQ